MNKESDNKKTFTRRALILGACKFGLVTGLFGRMLYLQIIKNKEFSRLADKNRIKTEILSPLRGRILDRNNKYLAINEKNYQLVFEKLTTHDKDSLNKVANKISDILLFNPDEKDDLIQQINQLNIDNRILISDNLSWVKLVKIELHLYELPGVSIKTGSKRLYPYGEVYGHLTGYVGTISNKEVAKSSIALYPNIKIGKNGIEKTQEKLLHGFTGFKKTEVNAKGEKVRDIITTESIVGEDINLSIDMELQYKITKMLGNHTGAVLVSKISTGEILSLVSQPSFDPNLFTKSISFSDWNKLINNPELPLLNRAVSLTYPPGSGFKINVAIAALHNKFNPKTKFFCPGHYTVGNRTFKCWKRSGHGSVDLHQAIARSCNVYFWNLAKIIGAQPIADIAREMGFDQKLLDNALPREQTGIMPDPEWKSKNILSKWTLADTINTAIGQGYVEATPLQMLTMVSRIASGLKVIPSIIKNNDKHDFVSLGLDRELEIVRKGMEMAVNSNTGTAYSNRIKEPGLLMSGKTGTSQVISKRHDNDDLSHKNIVKKIRNHGIFVSYAPLIKPEYAYCGIIEHGGSPSLAVKIAAESLKNAQLRKL